MSTSTIAVELVAEVDAHEGPVYVADEHALYFTSLPRRGAEVAIKRLELKDGRVSVLVPSANAANGMTLGLDGGLLVCEQGSCTQDARISRLDRATGERETVVDNWHGLPLNSPNDVVVRSDGTIWFTDPSYGFRQGFRPEPEIGDHVYRYDPVAGTLAVVANALDKPNGLAFSPDQRVLYLTDSGASPRIVAFDVVDGRRLARERLFGVVGTGFPDGIKVDADGRVYASSLTGVQIFSPAGEPLGEIAVPRAVNFAWAENVLYITNDEAVWSAELDTKGA